MIGGMRTDRNKHGWPFWFAVVAISVPALYVASIGPVCWIGTRVIGKSSEWFYVEELVSTVYHPVFAACDHAPRVVRLALHWYLRLGARSSIVWERTPESGYRIWQFSRNDPTRPR
jgi:hypothetical protein